jgi:peptidoglycan/LPS O-acetylase OafA/YrhL
MSDTLFLASERPPTAAPAIPSLDGIRAIAVSLVFYAHSGLERFIPGGLGVTIFFVLSGFLITTLMRIEYDKRGRIAFGSFYLRRLIRLMPPLAVVVCGAWLLSALGVIDGRFSLAGLLSALFYFGNYHVIAQDFGGMPRGMGIVWSLAIEEHYYLLYPPLAALLLHWRRPGASVLVLTFLCIAVLLWRYWLVLHDANLNYIMMATDTRVDAILIGCGLALWLNPWLDRLPAKRLGMQWFLAATSVIVLICTFVYRDEFFRLTLRYTLQSLAIAVLLYLAVAHADRPPFRWLSARPLVYIGSISYSIYLSHHLILLALTKHWPQGGWLGLTIVGAVLTLLVAEPMRRWVEVPCALWRRRLHEQALLRARRPVGLAVVAP